MPKGNPNPSPETRFQAGNNMNPSGKSSEQRQREIANAERATRLRGRMLVALEKQLDDALTANPDKVDVAALKAIQKDILRLLKDSEDRGLGAPVATVRGPGEDGGFVNLIRIIAADGPANTEDTSGDDSTAA